MEIYSHFRILWLAPEKDKEDNLRDGRLPDEGSGA